MKIGILAYCSACNFGAQLQLLSTYCYVSKHGHTPIIINWLPGDLEAQYNRTCKTEVLSLFEQERNRLWNQTRRCYTAEDVSSVIIEYKIESIIVGSDAVAQHRPLLERIKFPTRRFLSITHPSSDMIFPNPFWGTFNDYLPSPIPVAAMSVSSQDSRYKYFEFDIKKRMAVYAARYKYLSVRDSWTASMFHSIMNNGETPEVTPDPVFGFEDNVKELIPSKDYIEKKFNLPEEYIIVSFHDRIVTDKWLEELCDIAHNSNCHCVNLPYADKEGYGTVDINIKLPITPLEWYALIKYSKAYIGENMHPIVVCLHNKVPFYSFDNYGLKFFNGLFTSDRSSKILHILKIAKLEQFRTSCISRRPNIPSARCVFSKLENFDQKAINCFSEKYLGQYNKMMESIIKALQS